MRSVFLKDAGGGKLSKFVTHHVFRDENRNERTPVVDIECVANKVGGHGRTARPSLDRLLGVVLVEFIDLLEEFPLDERTFF